MRRIIFVICFLILFLIALFAAGEMPETIGTFSWYSKRNSPDEIVKTPHCHYLLILE